MSEAIPTGPMFEDHHRPMIRCKEETRELVALLMDSVIEAISDELDKRDIKEGTFAALHCQGYEKSPHRFGITFDVHLKGPDDIAIEFRGIQ